MGGRLTVGSLLAAVAQYVAALVVFGVVAAVGGTLAVAFGVALWEGLGGSALPPAAVQGAQLGSILLIFGGQAWDAWRSTPRTDEWLVDHGRASLVARDDVGALWLVRGPGDSEPRAMVEVFDATPLPDGTRARYLLHVPPFVTPRAAVAWTFGLEGDTDYRPVVEA